MTGFGGGPGQQSGPPNAVAGPTSAPDATASVGSRVGDLRAAMEAEVHGLDREISEIELLIQQVTLESERHETRRERGESRASALERDPQAAPAELSEAHANLLMFTKRSMLFEAQQEVLEGKLKTLHRFRDRLVHVVETLGPLSGVPLGAIPGGGAPAAGAAFPPPTGGPQWDAVAHLRSQEDLRREIVRQLHDGPAQSLANIALQAEIVQRLVGRDDGRAQAELVSMRRMVQHALDTTKEFIFDVRPMVLDDLGLAPTLRRAAADRSRRAGVAVDFDSRGNDRRLSPDLESGLFRCIDEAMAGFLALRPSGVVVRLDWSETELLATIAATWPPPSVDIGATPPPSASMTPGAMPPALAAMIAEERSQEVLARSVARSLPSERLTEIGERARVLGVRLSVREEGRTLELVTRVDG